VVVIGEVAVNITVVVTAAEVTNVQEEEVDVNYTYSPVSCFMKIQLIRLSLGLISYFLNSE
jgi:hypothetical protein